MSVSGTGLLTGLTFTEIHRISTISQEVLKLLAGPVETVPAVNYQLCCGRHKFSDCDELKTQERNDFFLRLF